MNCPKTRRELSNERNSAGATRQLVAGRGVQRPPTGGWCNGGPTPSLTAHGNGGTFLEKMLRTPMPTSQTGCSSACVGRIDRSNFGSVDFGVANRSAPRVRRPLISRGGGGRIGHQSHVHEGSLGTLEPLRYVKPVTGCISRLATPRSAEPCERKGQNMVVPTLVVRPGEGRSVSLGGMGVVFKVSGADTGRAFAVVEHPIEPGRLVLTQVHLREDEYSYVMEGTIGARVGDQEVTAGPGSYLLRPADLCTRSGTLVPDQPGSWR